MLYSIIYTTVERPYKGSPYKGNFCNFGKSFGCPYKGNPCLKFSKIFNPQNLPYGKIKNFAYGVKIDHFASNCQFLLNIIINRQSAFCRISLDM